MTLPEGVRKPVSAVEQWCALIYDKMTGGGGVTPTGTISITENGAYDVTSYATADVDVEGGGWGASVTSGIAFKNPTSASALDLSGLDTSNFTDMSAMFLGCPNLTSINLGGIDTGNVTTMSSMFGYCRGLTSLDFSGFDTSNVTSMGAMFDSCRGLTSLDLSGFDTSNVTDMASMFNACLNLTSINLGGFDTGNVTRMSNMFDNCSGLTSLDLSGFDTGNVTNMSYMFRYCSNLTSLDLSGFDTGNVTDMSYMFNNCSKLTSIDLRKIDTTEVTGNGMDSLWLNASRLKSVIWGIESNSVVPLKTLRALDKASGTVPTDLNIYVRDSLLNSYKITQYWDRYVDCLKPISELPVALQVLYDIDPNDYL